MLSFAAMESLSCWRPASRTDRHHPIGCERTILIVFRSRAITGPPSTRRVCASWGGGHPINGSPDCRWHVVVSEKSHLFRASQWQRLWPRAREKTIIQIHAVRALFILISGPPSHRVQNQMPHAPGTPGPALGVAPGFRDRQQRIAI
jgi:hypothetical protein